MPKKYLIIFILIISLFFLVNQAMAYGWNDITSFYQQTGNAAGVPIKATPTAIIGQIITITLAFVGALFVIFMIWGGFLWLTSTGSEDKIGKAKKTMTWATIGIATVIAAYSITTLTVGLLPTGAPATPGGEATPPAGNQPLKCQDWDGSCQTKTECAKIEGYILTNTTECTIDVCCIPPGSTYFPKDYPVSLDCPNCDGKGNECYQADCERQGYKGNLHVNGLKREDARCAYHGLTLGQNCQFEYNY